MPERSRIHPSARHSLPLVAIAITFAMMKPSPVVTAQTLPWMDASLPSDRRAELLVSAMTLDEKIHQIAMRRAANERLRGCGLRDDSRQIEGIPRLEIPTIRMTNGPIGVGGGDCVPDRQATGLPTALAVAASWDPDLSARWGDIAGRETRSNAHHVFLAPGVNLGRIPHNGRNFEYFGEDPYLSGVMSVAQIRAVQAHGVQAAAKHYVANEQETDRRSMNVVVDDRTLHELYLLPFEMSVKDAGLAAIMCSYPRVNGVFACENRDLLTRVLRSGIGFAGYVMSDRGATQSTVASIKAGLDLEFATPMWFTPQRIRQALDSGEIVVADIDAMLRRRFRTMFRLGQFESPFDHYSEIDFSSHGAVARLVAAQSIVVLKNSDSLLPLRPTSLRSVAVFGAPRFAGAAKLPATGPRGFITVNAPYTATPVEGLQSALRAAGSRAVVRWYGRTDPVGAAAAAAAADVAVVMVGDQSLEGEDRGDLSLPDLDGVRQEALIRTVAAANARTIVVLKTGGPVLMPWLAEVGAVLEAWYPGQEDGNAVADVLFGSINPSGKLPITFPAREGDAATASMAQYPGSIVNGHREATYLERLDMGYRWYETSGSKPLFPFGFGLSYTTFSMTNRHVQPRTVDANNSISVRFRVTNTGRSLGAEVAQVYARLPPSAAEPKRLVAFEKIVLKRGESRDVNLTIDPRGSNHPLSIWNSGTQLWETLDGEYLFYVGNSSQALRLAGSVRVAAHSRAVQK